MKKVVVAGCPRPVPGGAERPRRVAPLLAWLMGLAVALVLLTALGRRRTRGAPAAPERVEQLGSCS